MFGTFSLLVCLLIATGKHCIASLSKSTSSIAKPISVGANPTISVNVTTSIQATNVQVFQGGTLLKTVEIRPSSIIVTDSASTGYDSRVRVTFEVISPNTHVEVKVAFTSIPKADDGLVITFKDTADVELNNFILDVEYCDIAFLQPIATSVNPSSTCGSGCVKRFICNPTFKPETFTAKCQDTATWNISTAPCSKACDNSFFTNAVAVNDGIVGNGDMKNFNCNCSKPVASFTRICGSDGQWSNQTDPCSSVCSANSISCGSPVSNGLLCGGEKHEFNCTGDVECPPITFELECQANGTWVDTTCNCKAVTCKPSSITCALYESNGQLCSGDTHIFRYTDTNNLKINSTFECGSNGTWVSTECDNKTVIDRKAADIALGVTYLLLLFIFPFAYRPIPDDSTICGYNVKTTVILLLLVAFVLVFSGLVMIVLGNDKVATAGIALASVGNGLLLIAVVVGCVVGKPM